MMRAATPASAPATDGIGDEFNVPIMTKSWDVILILLIQICLISRCLIEWYQKETIFSFTQLKDNNKQYNK